MPRLPELNKPIRTGKPLGHPEVAQAVAAVLAGGGDVTQRAIFARVVRVYWEGHVSERNAFKMWYEELPSVDSSETPSNGRKKK